MLWGILSYSYSTDRIVNSFNRPLCYHPVSINHIHLKTLLFSLSFVKPYFHLRNLVIGIYYITLLPCNICICCDCREIRSIESKKSRMIELELLFVKVTSVFAAVYHPSLYPIRSNSFSAFFSLCDWRCKYFICKPINVDSDLHWRELSKHYTRDRFDRFPGQSWNSQNCIMES